MLAGSRVGLVDRELSGGKLADGWLDFRLAPAELRQGANGVKISLAAPNPQVCQDLVLRVAYSRK